MVYCSSTNTMSTQNESVEVNSLICWNPHSGGNSQDFLLDGHKLLLSDNDLDSLSSDSESQKNTSLDILDNLLSNTSSSIHPSSQNTNLAELKPLPPFTGYTGHLSINGISGHHYHAIAQRLPEENNNSYTHVSFNQCSANENNIVSSSTCLPDSGLSDASESCLPDVKLFSENSIESKIYSTISSADSCLLSSSITDNHSNTQDLGETKIFVDAKELVEYDMSSIEDIAAIIGSAIADTTVPNNRSSDNGDTRDSWMDLDAWIEETVVPQESKLIASQNESLSEFLMPHSPLQSNSTLQNLLSHGYMPLLQNRLQNGPPIKNEAQSTSYCNNDIITTSTSPPGSVCSSTDLGSNGNRQNFLSSSSNRNFSHTITSSSTTNKLKRPRNSKKNQGLVSNTVASTTTSNSIQAGSSMAHGFQTTSDLNGLLGKEKPVHRCTICNRGFLNKSNIKVHLRTHTGEKPFRCETCAKAFRQKAHLIKHQQIHKRIGRD